MANSHFLISKSSVGKSTAQHSQPLWRLLVECAKAVQAVESGHSLTEHLDQYPSELKPGVQALSFVTMRKLGKAKALLKLLVNQYPSPWVRGLLLTALVLAEEPMYTPYTLVNQAVQACKKQAPAATKFVNAVLRRFLREKPQLQAAIASQASAMWNHPDWLIKKLQNDWPQQWMAILEANNQLPPMTLRVNRRKHTVNDYQRLLQAQGLESLPVEEDGLILVKPCSVEKLPGFKSGDVSVQDAHAQIAAPLLLSAGIPAGASILDACSAPGGKTAHLLERTEAQVLALDVDQKRLLRVNETLDRLQLKATTLVADAGAPHLWWDGNNFDAILLDAPCSASGIVRRHPDIRWLRRPSDIDQLAKTQMQLLQALWPLLKTNGVLLYCTCSVFKEEGQAVIDAFLQRNTDGLALASPGYLLPVVEYCDGQVAKSPAGDGFFYAMLRKLDHSST